MLRNCLSAAWRNAVHDRFYALLNVLGLALGLAAVILIWLFVRDEVSFNRFLAGYQDVYRVQLTIGESGQRPATWASTPERMAAELKLDFPEIAGAARDAKQSAGVRHGEVSAAEAIEWVDPTFLTVLGYPLLRGDPATALAEPDSIVLTRTLAQKYFGTIDCIGRTLDINQIHPIRVTGIAEDPPPNSSVKFTALASGKTGYGKLATLDAAPQVLTALNITVSTYVRLRPGTAPDSLTDRLRTFALAHYPSGDPGEALFQSLYLNSLATVHLYPFNPDTNEPNIRMQTLFAVAATGLLILLLAGINFVNLVTARATRRAVEIGMRKALGARRSQLLLQFMGESIGYSLVAMVLAMGVATLFLPYLNAFLDRGIAFDFWRQPLLAAVPIAASVLLGAIAGVYPAVILSRFRPAQVLKAGSGGLIGGGRMRLGLVVFQFTVTIALLIATTVIYRQISFATSKALRFEKDLILTVDLTGMPQQSTPDGLDRRENAPVEALRTQMAGVPGVRAIAGTFVVPLLTQSFTLTDDRTRRAAANALGKARPPGSAEALAAALARDAEGPTRKALIEALGKAGGEAAVAALSQEIEAIPGSVEAKARLMAERTVAREVASHHRRTRAVEGTVPVVLRCRQGSSGSCSRSSTRILGAHVARRPLGGARIEAELSGPARPRFSSANDALVRLPAARDPHHPRRRSRAGDRRGADVEGRARSLPALHHRPGALPPGLGLGRKAPRRGLARRLRGRRAGAQGRDRSRQRSHRQPVGRDGVRGRRHRSEIELSPRLADPRFTYRKGDVPAASHPTIAAALIRAGGVKANDIVWDPFMGSGLELCERALAGPYQLLIGTDRDVSAIAIARENLAAAGARDPILMAGDATSIALPGRPSLIVTNPPLGRRVERTAELSPMLDRLMARAARSLVKGGRMVWIAPFPEKSDHGGVARRADDRRGRRRGHGRLHRATPGAAAPEG